MAHPLTETLELVRKAQAGDDDALNRLIGRYEPRLLRSVRVRLGRHLRAQLESGDILQLTFGKAFQNFERFEMRDEGSFLNWLGEYAEHQIRDAVRRMNAQKNKPPGKVVSLDDDGGDGSEAGREVAGMETGPIDRADKNERDEIVDECLDELPEHYRMVIVLRGFEGLQWQDIAEKLGKNTESAARELHRRALAELAMLLRRRGIRPGETDTQAE